MHDLLAIDNLRTYFHTSQGVVKAVDGVSIKICEQEIVGLVGESGCGKSTMALSIMRLVSSPGRIDGSICFKGKNLLSLTEEEMRKIRGRQISIVFQDPFTFLNPVMKIGDQLSEAVSLHREVDKASLREEIIELLKTVRLPSPANTTDSYSFQLSGGMCQRTVIAIALSGHPSLLIADEPTTALDVTVQLQILNLLRQLKNELKMSILLITHDLGIVAELCDRVYVMYAGKIVEHANVFSLFEKPLHPYTAGLLGSVLSIDEFMDNLTSIRGDVPDLIKPPSGCRFHPRCQHCKAVCSMKEPPMIEIERGHFVSCWLLAK